MKNYRDLSYLQNKPKVVKWKVVAEAPGKILSKYEKYDLVFDEHDYRIRQL